MTAARADLKEQFREMPAGLRMDRPEVADGAAVWRIARDSGTLDLNSSYSYLLWCRDFADTSVVARDGSGQPVGFITGYVRPAHPGTLVVWQVAVDAAHRGRGLAAALLDGLTARVAADLASAPFALNRVETTITPGNTASERLFTSFAARHDVPVNREVLFDSGAFPDGGHAPEILYRIGPFGT
ncbi:diaminobutyrate acetyltransferase [Streptomyces sp. NPDC059578]|uniref:diaminobutyrate acetyltransferase n=1 Tax=unclassified Streptomyces TaxID=2593676 RepID=UPI003657D2DD